MKAFLKNYSQSPRKVRLVADLIRGKDVQHARAILSFMDKKSAPDLKKLLESALANAENQKKNTEDLVVKEIFVDSAGGALRRWRPRAFGRAAPFRRHSSKITLQLGEKQ
ncbi:50S ribosomal protein L22 [bacterium]|nr:50S ribosomal protein L22 [Parcubacteria group bacterium]MBF05137.1 50S ribosomal protein L22 [bacterium]|tara:strand:- start:472 stop:801 length:330 start_codon:yes stop_codon:yes gene_type:complete